MASSGSFLSTGWYSSSKGDYVYLEFAWSVSNTSIAENYKDIYWELRGKRTASGYTMAGGFQVIIDGDTVYNKSTDYRIELRNGTIVASGTKRLWHNTDGTRSFKVHIQGGINTYAVNVSGDKNFDLDTIPRQATLTSAPDFTDLQNPTITYSNPAGNAVEALDACISFTGSKDDIAYRAISKTGSSYQFPLTEAERNVLRYNTTGPKRTVIFFVRTKIGGVHYWSTISKTLSIAETEATKPEVSISTTLNNGTLSSAFDGLYIQGKSRVEVSISASAKYDAKIQSYSANVAGKTYNSNKFTSDVIQSSGNTDIIGYAKDSREFTGSAKQTVNVIEYSKPLVIPLGSENAIQCYRSDGNGNRTGNSTSLWIKAKRFYYNLSGKNKCALQWRWKPVADQWNDSEHKWSDLIPKSNTTPNEYNALVSGEFDLKKSYTVQIRAIDDIGEYDIKPFEIPTQDVALHLGKGGKNVAIGTYCDYSEERTFYSDWKAIFDKEVVIGGSPVVDHVIEEGTDGIWTYRKWNSGIAECWGKLTNQKTTPSWSNTQVQAGANLPFTFVEAPVVACSGGQYASAGSYLLYVDATKKLVEAYMQCTATPSDSAYCTFHFQVKGRWK